MDFKSLRTKNVNRCLKFLAVGAWMIFIFVLSGQLGAKSGSFSGSLVADVKTHLPSLSEQLVTIAVRKSAHIFMYGTLGILLANLLRDYKLNKKCVFGYGILIASVYASLDETHQYFVGGRSSSLRDVLIDIIGATIGISVYYGFVKVMQIYRRTLNKKDSND